MHTIDTNHFRRQLQRQRFGVPNQCALRPAIARTARSIVAVLFEPASARPSNASRRSTHGAQHGECRADCADNTDEIHVDGVDEVHPARITHRHRKYAGVRHDDVQTAKLSDSGIDRCAQLLARAHIGFDSQCPLAGLFDEGDGFAKVLGAGQRIGITVGRPADVHSDDVGAVFAKRMA